MKRSITVTGMVLVAAAAAALAGALRVVPPPQRRLVRVVPTPRPQAARPARRRCVRLGWKAPYWYAGGSLPQRER